MRVCTVAPEDGALWVIVINEARSTYSSRSCHNCFRRSWKSSRGNAIAEGADRFDLLGRRGQLRPEPTDLRIDRARVDRLAAPDFLHQHLPAAHPARHLHERAQEIEFDRR